MNFGATPLANALLTRAQLESGLSEPCFPLELVLCLQCSLLQITETVAPEVLFRNYHYFSSFSDTMLRHAAAMAEDLTRTRGLSSESLVIEIASNDGYLLKNFVRLGIPVMGVEPATNVARSAIENGVPTRTDFFGLECARRYVVEGLRADVIIGNNVLAHVADLVGFVRGVATLLKPGGVGVFEVPYVVDLVGNLEFDTVYHEHLCYFSLTALRHTIAAANLHVVDVVHVPIHGGSLRVTVAEDASSATARVSEMLEAERRAGAGHVAYFEGFASRADVLRRQLKAKLFELRRAGRRIAAYGASAKGTTLLSWCGIGRDLIEFVVDRSSHKQGRFTPGAHLEVLPPVALVEREVDFALLLTWNFADEILAQQSAFIAQGGRFILPVPEVRVIP